MRLNPWIKRVPHPKQQRFLLHSHTREVFFGGAAGGGKSESLWLAALQYVQERSYAAIIFRRTYADLALPSALMARSKSYLADVTDAEGNRAVFSEKHKTWHFPSGATITFGYLDKDSDIYRYDSSEFQSIGFDEGTQFKEEQYRFLFGRLRKAASSNVPLRMRMASNPGGRGHRWVKQRFVDEATRAKEAVFIPSRLEDNPSLDLRSYDENLLRLGPILYKQRRHGDWSDPEGGRFKREWFNNRWKRQGDYIKVGEDTYHLWALRRFTIIDPAASAKTSADWTVISTFAITPKGQILWLDCVRVQREIPDIIPLVQACVLKWRPASVGIESIAANSAVFQLAQRAQRPMIPAVPLSPGGRDKLVRAGTAISFASAGRLWLPDESANREFPFDDVLTELVLFTGIEDEDEHDDVVDTLSYAVEHEAGTSGVARAIPSAVGGI